MTIPTSATTPTEPRSMIPLARNKLGLLSVDAPFNGLPGTLLVDTGASGTVLDRSRAERLGLLPEATGKRAMACFAVEDRGATVTESQQLSEAEIEDLELGSMSLGGLRVTLVDLSQVNQQFEAAGVTPVDGVLGADVLVPRGAVIDYEAQG